MAVKKTKRAGAQSIGDVFADIGRAPRRRIPDDEMDPEVAYQIVHDQLMLDGNARLNLATFVGTWLEPQARRLMDETFDKNMINKDEYPQTAEMEMRCVDMISRLWHAPDPEDSPGCSTTGSSEAAMLGGLALKRRWQDRRRAEGKPIDTPNIIFGTNVQVCWEKFARYWDVEPREVPVEGDRLHIDPEGAAALCDENTIGVVGILGSTYDGSYEPIAKICKALDKLQERTGLDIPVHVDAASGGFFAPFLEPELEWDFRLERVVSINASGHKYGLVAPGVGWIIWRDEEHLPEELIFKVNYLGDIMPTFALNFSRPGAQVVAQYYNFIRLGFEGYRRVQQYSRDVAQDVARRSGEARPVRAGHPRHGPAGLRVQGARRGHELQRVRRVRRPARARLAGAGLHLPQEPRGPRGPAGGGEARVHARRGVAVRGRPAAPAAQAGAPGRARERCRVELGVQALGVVPSALASL